jgi:hypothetical protein
VFRKALCFLRDIRGARVIAPPSPGAGPRGPGASAQTHSLELRGGLQSVASPAFLQRSQRSPGLLFSTGMSLQINPDLLAHLAFFWRNHEPTTAKAIDPICPSQLVNSPLIRFVQPNSPTLVRTPPGQKTKGCQHGSDSTRLQTQTHSFFLAYLIYQPG